MSLRVLFWISPFLIGLGIAWCGAQLIGGESAAESQVAVVTVRTPPTDALPRSGEEAAPPVSSSTIPAAPDPALSPLATRVRPLGSALPAEALEGVGEPVGTSPRSISIESLGVESAPIEPVGIEDDGELEVPEAEAVGWYRFGVGVDGGRGSTVLAAHIAFNGVDGVFRNLADTEAGATVSVVDETGELRDYVVTEVVQYVKTELPRDLFREDGSERLVLITCGGDFNPSLRSYDDNVVVIAEPV